MPDPRSPDGPPDGPGAARAGALEALAEIGGEAVISARDIAAPERPARIALADDTPVDSHGRLQSPRDP